MDNSDGLAVTGAKGTTASKANSSANSGGKQLPSGAMLDPCMVNSAAVRNATVPGFGGFGTALGLSRAVSHTLFESLSKRMLRRLSAGLDGGATTQGGVTTIERTQLFGEMPWGSYGWMVFELPLPGKNVTAAAGRERKEVVLCHHAFGGSMVVVVPAKELVVTVLVNCLTLDRSVTKAVVTLVLAELGVEGRPDAMFDGVF